MIDRGTVCATIVMLSGGESPGGEQVASMVGEQRSGTTATLRITVTDPSVETRDGA